MPSIPRSRMRNLCLSVCLPVLIAAPLSACQLSKTALFSKAVPDLNQKAEAGDQAGIARGNMGGLDKSHIDGTISEHLAKIRQCYEAQLSVYPNLKGGVKVNFTIAEDGKVSQAAIHSTSLKSPSTEDCLVTVFNQMVFPRPSGGIVMVQYPFLFDS